jgi:hypothetical protein
MTATTDRNDLLPAQEKLEWVTPKISLMDAGDKRKKIMRTKLDENYKNAAIPSHYIHQTSPHLQNQSAERV